VNTRHSVPQEDQRLVMPMGISKSPGIFQNAMTTILAKHMHAGYCGVYLDHILIYSNSLAEHAIDSVLNSLKEHSLYCQLPKCEFALKPLRYLGHLVSGEGIRQDFNRSQPLQNGIRPQTWLQLRKYKIQKHPISRRPPSGIV
jgi:hypothetical protein